LEALMRRVHAARGLSIEVEGDPALRFAGRREDLEEMLGNLLDNACKWARSRVRVRITAHGAGIGLQVDDDGPGLDPGQHGLALQRGVRLAQRAPGSGLGLAIVEDLASAHGGVLRLGRSELGGLCATLAFEAPART